MNLIAEDALPSREEVYQALVRSLRRRKGFGIVFVQCSPAEATKIMGDLQEDLPQKQFTSLSFDEPIDNLYDIVAKLPQREHLNILFIQGLEKSLEPYIQPGYGGDGDYYNVDSVPTILSHLNQRRELFRDHFHSICFVFFLPLFAIKYIIRRAPDLFDWSAGVFEFISSIEQLNQESQQILLEGNYKKYCDLTLSDKTHKILKIQEMIGELKQNSSLKAKLLVEQGNLFTASSEYENAISSYKEALNIQQENYIAWHNCGYALSKLGRHQEAIASYNKAIKIKPNFDLALQDRGDALIELGQDQEASVSYNIALFNLEFEILIDPKNRLSSVLYSLIRGYSDKFYFKGIEVDEIINEIYLKGYELIVSGRELKDIFAWIKRTAYLFIRDIAIKKHEILYLPDLSNVGEPLLYYTEPSLNEGIDFNIETDLQKLDTESLHLIRLYFMENLSQSEVLYLPDLSNVDETLLAYVEPSLNKDIDFDIETALQKLDTESQRLIRLYFIEKLSQREIGILLGMPQYSVSRKMTRVLQHLRVALNESNSKIKPDYYKDLNKQNNDLLDLQKTITSYYRAIEIKPDDHPALYNRGIVLENLGRYEEAINSYSQALEIYREIGLRGNEANALKKLAELHQTLGEVEVARQYCQQALALATELGIPLAAECEVLLLKIENDDRKEE